MVTRNISGGVGGGDEFFQCQYLSIKIGFPVTESSGEARGDLYVRI